MKMHSLPSHFQLTRPSAAILLALGGITLSDLAIAETYAPWLRQIGVTSTIESAANWGKGQVLGVVDTGINATHPEFASGQVSQASSSCAAVTFRCSNGYADDNGHGTAVASIAAGNRASPFTSVTAGGYTTVAGNIIGVAPSANILAKKVLNASGSAYSTDIAAGVRKAADAGAMVINVSITYGNDAATVAAINYAAAKGAFIVWAGGNSAQKLLNNSNTNGLTATAIQHLIFAGSVNSSNVASSFTNKPGSGSLVSTSGSKTSYASRWIMAPGESIIAPNTVYGNSAYSLWSGTSMSTPIVSGSLMLLQNTWPILRTQGTTANLLLATAKDLGTKGVDTTYGYGLVNLQTAFNPYGTLSVTKTNGQTVAVSSLSGTLISSGALGSLSSIQSKLANYTAFDTYARNFSVNLSGLIKSPRSAASLNPLPSNAYSAPNVMKFGDGELTFSLQNTSDKLQHLGEFGYNAELETTPTVGYTLYTSKTENIVGFGYGTSSSYTFAKSLYNDEQLARPMHDFDARSISSLAQGGHQFAYGFKLSPQLRLAAAYTSTATTTPTLLVQSAAQTSQIKLGLAYRIDQRLTGGLTYSNVAEKNSLLGAAYASASILSLGQNATDVFGLTAGYHLSHNSSLIFNAEFGRTRAGNSDTGSLFAATTDIESRAWGVTYQQQNLWKADDQLLASVKQPLRISKGSAALLTADVDAQGYAVYDKSWSSLVPDGREIDYTLAYRLPKGKAGNLTLQAVYQKDALNIAGNNNALLGMNLNQSF